jgi:hypothetical protein
LVHVLPHEVAPKDSARVEDSVAHWAHGLAFDGARCCITTAQACLFVRLKTVLEQRCQALLFLPTHAAEQRVSGARVKRRIVEAVLQRGTPSAGTEGYKSHARKSSARV